MQKLHLNIRMSLIKSQLTLQIIEMQNVSETITLREKFSSAIVQLKTKQVP